MTEQSIIERAARALLASQEPSLLWDDLVEFDQEAYKADARAVITAIREPGYTALEKAASLEKFPEYSDCNFNFTHDERTAAWQAMIDAMLA